MKQAADIIAIMFISREQAHREHLKTKSYAKHVALNEFYDGIVGIADEFAETCMGFYGQLGNIPYLNPESGSIIDVLETHLESIQSARKELDGENDSPLQNIIDNACSLYARTLYKLRNLS